MFSICFWDKSVCHECVIVCGIKCIGACLVSVCVRGHMISCDGQPRLTGAMRYLLCNSFFVLMISVIMLGLGVEEQPEDRVRELAQLR